MKILFDFDFINNKHLNIPCNLPITIQDRLDGLTDSISFEFMYNDDLLLEYHKYQKAVLKIYENEEDNTPFKEYRMVISDLNRDTNTMYMDNNAPLYTYTCTLIEPTVLIDENIRTNITITPYLYPKQENGHYPYETLYDAYNKILSCHNLCSRNEKVYGLQTTELNNITSISFDSNNENVYVSGKFERRFNLIEIGNQGRTISYTTPQITLDREQLPYSKTVTVNVLDLFLETMIEYTILLRVDITYTNNQININFTQESGSDALERFVYKNWSIEVYAGKEQQINLKNLLENVACPSLTYIDLSTFDQLSDLFDRVGAVPYLDYDQYGKCYVTYYLKQGSYNNEIKTLSNLSTEEVSRPSDLYSNTISSQLTNMVCDDDLIIYPRLFSDAILKDYASSNEDNRFTNTINVSLDKSMSQIEYPYDFIPSGENEGAYFGIDILLPNGFDSASEPIGEANSYFVQLPTNIEYIEQIYIVSRNTQSEGGRDFILKPVNKDRIVEYSVFNATQDSQKHYFAYYVRGENKIKQICSLISSIGQLDGDWAWSSTQLFKNLRKTRLVVVYKPMLNTNYTSYDYNNLNTTTTKYIDLPYKLVSDKQSSNLLSYELSKYNSNKILFNQVSTDINELNHFAGERVFYKGKRFIPYFYQGSFTDYTQLNNAFPISSENINPNLWARVNNDIYFIDTNSNKWIKYIGEQCVITKIAYTVHNNTISASYELSNKVAFNSSVSGYSDNVRVSDNLSSENVVNRNIQLYKTVLLNGVITDDATIPSLVSDKATPFLSDLDSFILVNALNQQNYGQYEVGVSDIKNSKLNDLNKIGFNIKTNTLVDTTVWNSDYWTTQESQTFETLDDFVTYLVGDYTSTTQNYPFFSYNSINSDVTAYRIFKVNGVIYLPDRMIDIPHDFNSDSWEYQYAWWEVNGQTVINFQYREKYTDLWNTISSYNIQNISYPATLEIGVLSQDDTRTNAPKFASQYNTVWQNSNTITNVSMYNQDPSIIGYYAEGSDGGDTFYKTVPLFYNTSDAVNNIENIGNYNVKLYSFKKLLEGTGFSDLNLDLRENVSCNLQYIILPNNTNHFLINYFDDKFDIYPEQIKTSYQSCDFIHIKELNNNLQWFSNIPNITKYSSTLVIYRVPKGTTLNDYINNKNIGTTYTRATSKIVYNNVQTQQGILTVPSIKINLNSEISSDEQYDYIIEDDVEHKPLLLFSNEGCKTTSQILLTTFTI